MQELTVVEKIWGIILEFIAIVANLLDIDEETLMTQILEDDRRLELLRAYAQTALNLNPKLEHPYNITF